MSSSVTMFEIIPRDRTPVLEQFSLKNKAFREVFYGKLGELRIDEITDMLNSDGIYFKKGEDVLSFVDFTKCTMSFNLNIHGILELSLEIIETPKGTRFLYRQSYFDDMKNKHDVEYDYINGRIDVRFGHITLSGTYNNSEFVELCHVTRSGEQIQLIGEEFTPYDGRRGKCEKLRRRMQYRY